MPVPIRGVSIAHGIEINTASGMSVGVLESVAVRKEHRISVAEMPFANQAAAITSVGEQTGDAGLLRMQPPATISGSKEHQCAEQSVTRSARIPPREESESGRGTDG